MLRRIFLAVAVLVAALAAFAMIDSVAASFLYPAPPVRVPSPPPAPLAEVRLKVPKGEVVAWTSQVAPPAGAPLVLFFHGNGENLETMRQAGLFEEIADLGVGFLAVDYPGYGRSPGRASEAGLEAAADAAIEWAAETHPDRPVVAVGWSLGAAVAVPLAARHPERVTGLIALSPWTSLDTIARVHFPGPIVKMLLRERYDSLGAARRVRNPALVVHGVQDEIIPVAQGRDLAQALPAGTRWVPVPGAGHNDLLARAEVWQEMASYLARLPTD